MVVVSRAIAPTAALLLAVGGWSTVSSAGETRSWTSVVENGRCAPEVRRWIESWGPSGEILRAPPGIDGRERLRLATHELGVWITLEGVGRGGSRNPVLFRTSFEGSERVELSRDCRAGVSAVERAPLAAGAGGFTDRDLSGALQQSHRLVVFLWSPHMPLSADGLPEIEDAARATGAALVVVTDPSSERRFVDEVSREKGIRPEWGRPLASVELLFRDLAVHAPSILVFDEGRASAPLPGYRNRHDYRRFLEAVFSGSKSSASGPRMR